MYFACTQKHLIQACWKSPFITDASWVFFPFRWIAWQQRLPEVLTEPWYNWEGLRQSILPKGPELQNLLFPSFHKAWINWPLGHATKDTFSTRAFLGNQDEWVMLEGEQDLIFSTFGRLSYYGTGFDLCFISWAFLDFWIGLSFTKLNNKLWCSKLLLKLQHLLLQQF